MVRWIELSKGYYIGFFAVGLVLFILQQLPYIIMPFLHIEVNPLMEMVDKSAFLNTLEKVLGVSCVIATIFLVKGDSLWFSLENTKEIVFFSAAMLAIAIYFVGWSFYFRGNHILALMLFALVAMPPIYYALIGLWRGNYILAHLGGIFLIAHLANVWNNLK